jgi:2-haloacid dehalogenase
VELQPMTEPTSRRCYVFDAYGTLFDVHSASRRFAAEVGPGAARFSEIWRAKQLEYTWIYSRLERAHSFAEVTGRGLDFAAAVTGGIDPELRARLLASYRELSAYPEVWRVLTALYERSARLAILSNGDPDMLADIIDHAGLDGFFEHVLSVEAAGLFKPAPAVYALATKALEVKPADITFISANRWDIAGAKSFGFRTVWVNRAELPDEYPELAPDVVLADLSALAMA